MQTDVASSPDSFGGNELAVERSASAAVSLSLQNPQISEQKNKVVISSADREEDMDEREENTQADGSDDRVLSQQENAINLGYGRDLSHTTSPLTDLATLTTAPADTPENVSHSVMDTHSPSTPIPPTPRVTQSLDVPAPTSGDRSPSPSSTHQSLLDRRASRRRSGIEGRAANRFSGFLSNLIHRRPDREHGSSSSLGPSPREDRDLANAQAESSRASSPTPTRPVTPPPSLPPPSLHDLGLSLTAITATLHPSHFSTPPLSGTFLAPHYLLLCHAQGLDVLPLVAPPSPQPYALIRRVGFKSVVVMEERGVLVAIAGRRDGVRVYALDDVKKAVEWRIEVEVRREREKHKREEAKRGTSGGVDRVFGDLRTPVVINTIFKSKSDTPKSTAIPKDTISRRRISIANGEVIASRPSSDQVENSRKSKSPSREPRSSHDSDPPPYQMPSPQTRPRLIDGAPTISMSQMRTHSGSISDFLTGTGARRHSVITVTHEGDDEKRDWDHETSDDEAINMATAGPSGSAALDERTSSHTGRVGPAPSPVVTSPTPAATLEVPSMADSLRRTQTSSAISTLNRRNRPAHLDLSRAATQVGSVTTVPPSPTPSVWTLRQALSAGPTEESRAATPDIDAEDDDESEANHENITFAQALLESRLPGVAPPGSRVPQQPIILGNQEPSSPRTTLSSAHSHTSTPTLRRNRRRWSVLDGVFTPSGSIDSTHSMSPATPTPNAPVHSAESLGRLQAPLARISSVDVSATSPRSPSPRRPSSSNSHTRNSNRTSETAPPVPPSGRIPSGLSHRFLPRILTSAFNSRRADDHPISLLNTPSTGIPKRPSGTNLAPVAPAPKLEYVKLPGTKGALLIKAVETAKKSFLAILCGEQGEKIELFAGTYRTTLGLSRTFILPDSPRSLELQLQGDDLVEVFLVFSQNVFGLEPATVRVREVRVGRAERRAARRRAREARVEDILSADAETPAPADEDVNVNVSVSFAASSTTQSVDDHSRTPPPLSRQNSESNVPQNESIRVTQSDAQTDELTSLTSAQLAPYTTFQQLSFAPQFPLAAIADECIIPPTYLSVMEFRAQYESDGQLINGDLATVQFAPPGLPVPPALPPSKWYYIDPKGIVQGPWKASLMQLWYRERLLPPDLPVRREEDTKYTMLKDLRAQSVDPTHPFRPPPPTINDGSSPPSFIDTPKPLLEPISLLTQPRHYGPPALFFTTRGGHSTAIVDSRGRSVLKGRLNWSTDDDEDIFYTRKLGDVKHLEAFDVKTSAVIVAVRQGGLEVADIGDSIMKPGDLSRSHVPYFQPPTSHITRRGPFVWRIGSPLSPFAAGPVSSSATDFTQTFGKKHGLGIGKSPAKSDYTTPTSNEEQDRMHEELLFLGRRDDNVYFCERNNGSFRILRLCPIPS